MDPKEVPEQVWALVAWLEARKLSRSAAVPIFASVMAWGIAEQAHGTPDAYFEEGLELGRKMLESIARDMREKFKQQGSVS
jgi:hypothetical protein